MVITPSRLEIAAVFPNESGKRATALSFHEEGQVCVSCGGDGSIRLIDCLSGTSRKVVRVQKFGVSCAAYTHHDLSIIHGGGEGGSQPDNAIRYLSLYDNKYLRVFRGHEDAVVSLAMCPSNDVFVSCSLDGKLAVWDLGSSKGAVATLDVGGAMPRAAYSPDGLVLAVSSADVIRLYDSRNYRNGPFTTFRLSFEDAKLEEAHPDLVPRLSSSTTLWTGLVFSPDGERLLLRTDAGVHLVYDAFDFGLIDVLYDASALRDENAFDDEDAPPLDVCNAVFSPDGSHVLAGTADSLIRVWRLNTTTTSAGRPHVLKGHACPVFHLAYSPKFDVLASACASTCLWLPPPT